ncbi:hypothetical protein L6R52_29890 [Myxococcota bacterium]|nr:hypothetical protein [Myxococcota bacterium]
MAEQNQVENTFFDEKDKPDTGSGYFKAYQKPPSNAARIAVGVFVIAAAIAVFLLTRRTDYAVVWVLNPGPDPVHVVVAENEADVEAGRLVEARVAVEKDFQVGAFRGDKTEDIKVELGAESAVVELVDLAGDGAYVVADVSSFYAEKPGTTFPIVWESTPKRVHSIPYPSTKLVRPGRAMPEKGSWELQVFQTSKGIEMYKVFRVDPAQLADKAKLAATLASMVNEKRTGEAESLRVIVTSTIAK